jgi:hypothetical protein
MTRDQIGHDRSVDNTQSFDSMDSQFRVDYCCRVSAHFAGARRMLCGGGGRSDPTIDLGWAADFDSRGEFLAAKAIESRRCRKIARNRYSIPQCP